MVPILNAARTDVACVGNHDLDFGVDQFAYLANLCEFPWLCSNVEDPALGEGISIARVAKTKILESGGRKVGVIGVVEKEWLETVNSLPEGLVFIPPAEAVLRWVPALREAGAEMVVVVSHMREPNDIALAEALPENYVDVLLGGHDHHYSHQLINNIHLLRSGCDFKQLSYLTAHPSATPGLRYDFTITAYNTLSTLPADPQTEAKIKSLTAHLNSTLGKPIGHTLTPLDSRFTTVRCAESNLGNFVCDIMRFYHSAQLSIIAGGTIRGDQIYPPGTVHLGDMINCFPFEDPVVVVRVPGRNFIAAIENGLAKLPALEGRFPHVSGCKFTYDSRLPEGGRVLEVRLDSGALVDPDAEYTVVTRGYMVKGKDGFTALSHEAGAVDVVDEENGVLISMILRQYFLSLKVMGRWKRGGYFRQFFHGLKDQQEGQGVVIKSPEPEEDDLDSGSDDDDGDDGVEVELGDGQAEAEPDVGIELGGVVRRLAGRWKMRALDKKRLVGEVERVEWTSAIAPRLEGRIVDVAKLAV